MTITRAKEDIKSLVEGLNFAEKVERSLRLIARGVRGVRRQAGRRQQPRQGFVRRVGPGQAREPRR